MAGTTLMSMLENEKYKGDALLQKSYTVDFLTKNRTQNKGEIQMFYVEDDHDAIISKRIWECVHISAQGAEDSLCPHYGPSYQNHADGEERQNAFGSDAEGDRGWNTGAKGSLLHGADL